MWSRDDIALAGLPGRILDIRLAISFKETKQ